MAEHDLLIKALASGNRSSPIVIDVIDRITSRSELLARMATEYGSLNRSFITAITKFQTDHPVFSRAEQNELVNVSSGFDNESFGVLAQMTMRTTNNTDKQKRLLAGENVWFCDN